VTLGQIRELLHCELLSPEFDPEMTIESAIASDLMSDVLAFAESGVLLLTGLTNSQVVRTCEIAGVCAVVFVRGKRPSPETIQMGAAAALPALLTGLNMFEACGILHAHGLRGVQESLTSPEGR
jgi:tRNA G18 (ribose-2'-O)-methylase SpoU